MFVLHMLQINLTILLGPSSMNQTYLCYEATIYDMKTMILTIKFIPCQFSRFQQNILADFLA